MEATLRKLLYETEEVVEVTQRQIREIDEEVTKLGLKKMGLIGAMTQAVGGAKALSKVLALHEKANAHTTDSGNSESDDDAPTPGSGSD